MRQSYRSGAFEDSINAALRILVILRAVLQGSAVLNEPDRHFLLKVIRKVELDCTDTLFELPAAPLVVIIVLHALFGLIYSEFATLPSDLFQVLLRVRLIKHCVNVI